MTPSSPLAPDNGRYGRALRGGFGLAAATVAGIALVAWLAGVVAAELELFMLAGVGTALLALGAALLVHARILAMRSVDGTDGALLAGRLQGLLGLAFVAKLVVLGAAVFGLHRAGVKFEAVAAFGIAFAAAAVIGQLIAAFHIARVIGRPASGADSRLTAAIAGGEKPAHSHQSDPTSNPPC